ncbi:MULTISPECIES: bifunctional phosphoribosyl-AMP cyclohydrolase/phosphoribosyl-ATP diphosphatase HisIE [Sporosarcina]|uniref:bifunctional phosphoribosyl-AMP cyclohydrolase/phosphoribosyl-ATP diphosphatase HisIE n=1 Tax=Sporosarcina TaxID=1569 RepID=UPI0023EA744E|nr:MULTISPECIES: bifunctional phosphoribosyl-AMP cyclohydrolase/phosphoribosyl-ATP diphosphatase HisIE [Sporosarcina]WJY28951.1 bifunctional phosphoribosyl-AMP cyclohydrolase/phosphoribosyl-ATP diphosphatase HisIE [Sporosarcina sp. 0.2-SM1T-5]
MTLQELQEAKRSAGSSAVKWDENGLVPAILQDAQTKDVLTLAYMNDEALEKTIKTKETWLFSRSRQELWHKGKTSGNRQTVREIRYDCDRDAVLLLVDPMGPACHTGSASCFSGEAPGAKSQAETVLQDLADRIAARQAAPADGSYTSYLFREGLDKILKKVGEEATEVVIGAKNGNLNETANEIADLAYHVLVLMAELGLPAKNVTDILKGRKTEKE